MPMLRRRWRISRHRESRYVFPIALGLGLVAIWASLTSHVQVLEGGKVVERTGAVGKIQSVYVRDPDGNLIEYASSPFV
jgi:catechol 2,3-dioxygenase-like lactoylglutathione lyase family enzyme